MKDVLAITDRGHCGVLMVANCECNNRLSSMRVVSEQFKTWEISSELGRGYMKLDRLSTEGSILFDNSNIQLSITFQTQTFHQALQKPFFTHFDKNISL